MGKKETALSEFEQQLEFRTRGLDSDDDALLDTFLQASKQKDYETADFAYNKMSAGARAVADWFKNELKKVIKS